MNERTLAAEAGVRTTVFRPTVVEKSLPVIVRAQLGVQKRLDACGYSNEVEVSISGNRDRTMLKL